MIIDLLPYIDMKNAEIAAAKAAHEAELAQRAHLEWALLDLLADIQAA